MATLATMKARIADELARSDLTSQIANAINDAIVSHERERFWFNESRDNTFVTVIGQRIYTASDAAWINSIVEIDNLFLTVGGRVRALHKEDPDLLEFLTDNSGVNGEPYAWAYMNDSIQLYPVPTAIYTVRATGHVRLAALTDDTQSNAWTTEAERLIRSEAKYRIATEVTYDPTVAGAMNGSVQASLAHLRAETSRRKTTGRIEGSQF